jgi:hypothetical protein
MPPPITTAVFVLVMTLLDALLRAGFGGGFTTPVVAGTADCTTAVVKPVD